MQLGFTSLATLDTSVLVAVKQVVQRELGLRVT